MQRDNWSLGMMIREATKNVFSPAARLFPIVAVAVLLGAGQSALMIQQSNALSSSLADLRILGRNVVVVTPPSPDSVGAVTRDSCEALSTYDQVERSGLVGVAEYSDFSELGPLVPIQEASSTLVPLLRLNDAVVGSALSPETSRTRTLRLPSGQLLQSSVGPEMPAGVPVNSVLSVPLDIDTTTGTYCVAVLDPYLPLDESQGLVLADLQIYGEPLLTSTPFRENVDIINTYLVRTERFLPLGIAVLAGFSTLALSRSRASEFAAYRLSGTSRRSLTIIVVLEQAAVAGFYATSATMTVVVAGLQLRDPSVPILWAVVGALSWTLCAGSAASATAVRRASDLAKDR